MKRDEAIRRFATTKEERLGLDAHLRVLDLSYKKEIGTVKSLQLAQDKQLKKLSHQW